MDNKVKLGLYYVCALLTIIILYGNNGIWSHANKSSLLTTISVINIVLTITVTILLFKKSLKNYKVITPITYIIFYVLMTMIILAFNPKLRWAYMLGSYYVTFILIGYTILNIYTILSFEKKQPIKK